MEARYLTDLEWRICHAVNIYVFRNGKDGEQPILVHVPPAKKKNMRTLMNVIQDRVKYPVGYAKFLYKMDGTRVRDPCELEMYNNYVVASNFDKHFKCAAYGRKRSPLLVLNRDSKHVRVLKLQNQNYYEWLLKKKAVGEERPPYIYPTYYTNENYRPQDLPVGKMGNYHPPETQVPGCCYPRFDDGNKTFRIDANSQYVTNTVTVDVVPDLRNLTQLPKQNGNKQNNPNGKLGRKPIIEQTPSDMINANVAAMSDVTSQEAVTVESSETEDHRITTKNSPRKSHRTQMVPSDEFQTLKRSPNIDSSIQSLENSKKHHHKKSGRKTRKKRNGQRPTLEHGGAPPSPPSQFRDNTAMSSMQAGQLNWNNQERLSYLSRPIHDPNGNLAQMQTQKSFYYSPEKLAEINSAGNIQLFELDSVVQQHQPNPGPGQWAVIRQPQRQMFSIESQHAAQATPQLYHTQARDPNNNATFPSHYPAAPAYPVPNLQMQHPTTTGLQQQMQGTPMLLHSSHGGPPTQCVVIQNPNPTPNPPPPPTQLVTLQNPNSHIQHVYRLGIVQQQNPQTCIQVDGKAMRQYVDNQKLIESRFPGGGQYLMQTPTEGQGHHLRTGRTEMNSDQTESELDIPFTPLKTYRLKPTQTSLSDSKLSRRANARLPKVKSRNVAIQMGYPGTNTSPRAVNLHRRVGAASEVSVVHERNQNPFRINNRKSSSSNILGGSPFIGLETYFKSTNVNPRSSRRNFYESYSDQYINLQRRSPFVQKANLSSRAARGRYPSDPILEELVTIPPPTEFGEAMCYPERRRVQRQYSIKDIKPPPPTDNNDKTHPYCNDNNDRSNTQYNCSNYSY